MRASGPSPPRTAVKKRLTSSPALLGRKAAGAPTCATRGFGVLLPADFLNVPMGYAFVLGAVLVAPRGRHERPLCAQLGGGARCFKSASVGNTVTIAQLSASNLRFCGTHCQGLLIGVSIVPFTIFPVENTEVIRLFVCKGRMKKGRKKVHKYQNREKIILRGMPPGT